MMIIFKIWARWGVLLIKIRIFLYAASPVPSKIIVVYTKICKGIAIWSLSYYRSLTLSRKQARLTCFNLTSQKRAFKMTLYNWYSIYNLAIGAYPVYKNTILYLIKWKLNNLANAWLDLNWLLKWTHTDVHEHSLTHISTITPFMLLETKKYSIFFFWLFTNHPILQPNIQTRLCAAKQDNSCDLKKTKNTGI